LAYVTGLVNQELPLQNEYLAAENRILKARLQPGWRLSDGERATLAEIGKCHFSYIGGRDDLVST